MALSQINLNEPDAAELLRRDHTLNGGILFGLDGFIVEIQARAMEVLKKPVPWNCCTKIVGMARGAIREALDRISGAFTKLQLPNPQVSILINLVPADLPKDGTWLDVPLAVIMLQAAGILPDLPDYLEGDYILLGEVGIHGEIRRVPGALSIACCAKPPQSLIVPAGNEKECALILAKEAYKGCQVFPVSTLEELILFFNGQNRLENALQRPIKFESAFSKAPDIGLVKGQKRAKDAIYLAASGGHNLLLIGPPGEGKSFIARTLPGIMPRLSQDEVVELTRIYSAFGALEKDGQAVTRRPWRYAHHTTPPQALVGGGSRIPRPGEITLAHLGVLFLDEIAEFRAGTLDALRQPLEDGFVTIARVQKSLTFPCRFTLVAAMNACPCGFAGTHKCRCTPDEIRRYQGKLSGPIVDRIDLQVEMKPLSPDEKFAAAEKEASPLVRSNVEAARERQRRRFAGTDIPFNAAIPGGRVMDFCFLSDEALSTLKAIDQIGQIPTRSVDKLIKVARTVADLAGSERVEPLHITKASPFVVGGPLRK